MQNRYVGDVGDFAKYALLRSVAIDRMLRLGIIWCLFDDEAHNSDGRHVTYLRRPEFRKLDPELFDKLKRIIETNRRSVRAIPQAKLFPTNTIFFDSVITPAGEMKPRKVRQLHREEWLHDALAATASCELVFFDPDNGVETQSIPHHAPKSGKYIFWHELKSFWDRGQSLVVYHHLNRTMTVNRQTKLLKKKFSKAFPTATVLKPLLFRHGSCRHFWVIGQAKHARALDERLNLMIKSGWSSYFEVC